jgi:hypothetical protein
MGHKLVTVWGTYNRPLPTPPSTHRVTLYNFSQKMSKSFSGTHLLLARTHSVAATKGDCSFNFTHILQDKRYSKVASNLSYRVSFLTCLHSCTDLAFHSCTDRYQHFGEYWTLKMEAARSSETMVCTSNATRHHDQLNENVLCHLSWSRD